MAKDFDPTTLKKTDVVKLVRLEPQTVQALLDEGNWRPAVKQLTQTTLKLVSQPLPSKEQPYLVQHQNQNQNQHQPIWNERWPRNGPGSIWMSDDSDDDELTEPVQIHIRWEDLIDAHGHDQQIKAEQAYQTVKSRHVNQTGRPRRAAKDKALLGLKVYKAWCKGTTAKSVRKGPNHQCTVTDNIDRFI